MITKRHIIDRAFAELGLSGYMFDASPEEQQDALYQLDSMMAEWFAAGVNVSFVIPTDPTESYLTDDSGIALGSVDGVAKSLALRLCPSYGKQPSPQLIHGAQTSKNALWVKFSTIPSSRYPQTMPIGAGNRRRSGLSSAFYNGSTIDNTLPE